MWRRKRALEDLDADIHEHIEREVEDNVARGMSPDEARRQARLTFGNPALTREDTRAVWAVRWIQTLQQDVRNGVRILIKHPGVTIAAVLSLAIGIGANTAVFSVVNRVLLASLPYHDPDRLVLIRAIPPDQPGQRTNATIPEYIVWQRQASVFDSMATAFQQPLTLGADDAGTSAETVLVEKVRASLFDVLDVQPAIGRAFRADEEQTDAPAPVVLLSDEFWASRYHRDPAVVGTVIRLNRIPTTIVGVMPPGFTFLPFGRTDLYAPLSWNTPQLRGTARVFPVVARLKPGVTLSQAQANMDAVMAQAAAELPAQSHGWSVRVAPLQESLTGDLRPALMHLQGVVGFVLLIACANVAGLLSVRSTARRTEIAVRAAIGARRGRIVRQLLTESVVLATVGGLAGLVVGWLLLKLLMAMSSSFIPTLPAVAIDGHVLVFTFAIAVLTGFIVGVLPALEASRPDLVEALKASAKGAVAAPAGQRIRRTIVVAQIALSFVLLIGAGLTLRSFVQLQTRELGGDPDGVLRANVAFTDMFRQVGTYEGYPLAETTGDVSGTIDQFLDRFRLLPGVQSVAAASLPPFVAAGPLVSFTTEGRANLVGISTSEQHAAYQVVTPGFFATMRIPMERGREFDTRDTAGGPWGIVINAAMARRFWPGEDPIGQRVRLDLTADEQPREVIGIVSNYRSTPYELESTPAMFVLHRQQPTHARSPMGVMMRNRMNFVVRTSVEPDAIASAVRAVIREIDPDQPADLQSVKQSLGLALAPSRYNSIVFGLFAGVALLLAAVGTYGVTSHGIGQRTREISIRMALGARPIDVWRLVMWEVLVTAGVGVALGLAGALALTRLLPGIMASLAWGVRPTDFLTYAAVSLVLAIVALLAGWIPMRRAIRSAPIVALRSE